MNIEIYTEYTPNPESLKFVANKMLLPENSADLASKEEAGSSPLAMALFEKPYVQRVFIANNFVTITKASDIEWIEIMQELKEFLKEYISSDKVIINMEQLQEERVALHDGDEIATKIIGLLDQYVKPAVEMDGGAIQFKSFDEGIVTLTLQGSCSGCPSSTITLKNGIEGLLTRMVPEVKEVVAEME